MDPKLILLDLQKELSGELLEETFDLRGKKFTLRLLTESETGWVYSFVNVGSLGQAATLLGARLAMLAVGLRAIDGYTVEELLEGVWDGMGEEKRRECLANNHHQKKFALASIFMEQLSEYPPAFISELQEKWQRLEARRNEAQGEIKNS